MATTLLKMDREAYKRFHEVFVSNNKGTTLVEVTLISLVCPMSVFILAKLALLRMHNFAIELMIIVVPLLMIFTEICNAYIVVASMCLLLLLTQWLSPKHTGAMKSDAQKYLSFLSNYRASMLLVTAICILGVDFQTYPRRFAKTEELGFGVMDIGVGSFVFSAGIVAPSHSSKLRHNAFKSVPLFVLGALKYLSVKLVDYHEHTSEYGIHWNFFLTMGFVQLVCGTTTSLVNRKWMAILSILSSIIHEYLLVRFNYKWIFALTLEQRLSSGFVTANVEGLISLAGFASIYLLGASLKPTIHGLLERKDNLIRLCCKVILAWSIYVLTINEGLLVPPSRRLCNLSYIVWMGVYNMFLIASYSGIQFLTGFNGISAVYKAISNNAMLFFLVANLCTGLVNLTMQPSLMGDSQARMVISSYVLLLCYVFHKKESIK